MDRIRAGNRLSAQARAELSATLRGTLVEVGHPDYDEARRIWNGAHDRRPAAVIRCAGVADVVLGIRTARGEGLPLSIRGGGHSIPGFSTCDDGIVLDLSPMRAVRVDPARRRLRVQTGCQWRDVDAETQLFGLAVTGGLVSTTGVAGFTLGGGIGWLTRVFGLAADNLIGADLVTADGLLVHAEDDPDLLWALTGGGGNFGVATTLDFQVHDIGPAVFAGSVIYRGPEFERVLTRYRAACAEAPDGLTTLLKLTSSAAGGEPVIIVAGCWVGAPDRAEAVTRPFRSLGPVESDAFTFRPYASWQQALDPQFPRGLHCYFRSAFVPALTDPVIAALIGVHACLPNRLTEIVVHQLGGAAGRVAPENTAFPDREDDFIVNVIARGTDSSEFEDVRAFAQQVTGRLPGQPRTYVNFNSDVSAASVRSCYAPATLDRLTDVKNRYDPNNVFRLNHNIAPTVNG